MKISPGLFGTWKIAGPIRTLTNTRMKHHPLLANLPRLLNDSRLIQVLELEGLVSGGALVAFPVPDEIHRAGLEPGLALLVLLVGLQSAEVRVVELTVVLGLQVLVRALGSVARGHLAGAGLQVVVVVVGGLVGARGAHGLLVEGKVVAVDVLVFGGHFSGAASSGAALAAVAF